MTAKYITMALGAALAAANIVVSVMLIGLGLMGG